MEQQRPTKRKMKRRPQRRMLEFKERTGKTYSDTVNSLRGTISKKNSRIAVLNERLGTIKDEHDKEIHKLNVIHRREIRKLNTKFNNLNSKFESFKEKKGERNRTIIYKNKFKTYEAPSSIRNFEKLLNEVGNLPKDYLTTFEQLMKINKFIEAYNLEHKTEIVYHHYIILLNLTLTRGRLQGITAPKLVIPLLSQHLIRKSLNYLSDIGMVTKVTRISYRISLIGDKFLKDLKNFNSYGKSEVVEHIKRVSKLEQDIEEDYENI